VRSVVNQQKGVKPATVNVSQRLNHASVRQRTVESGVKAKTASAVSGKKKPVEMEQSNSHVKFLVVTA